MAATETVSESSLLQRVQVRLIEAHERAEFDRRLERDHYLHQPDVAGPTLRYPDFRNWRPEGTEVVDLERRVLRSLQHRRRFSWEAAGS